MPERASENQVYFERGISYGADESKGLSLNTLQVLSIDSNRSWSLPDTFPHDKEVVKIPFWDPLLSPLTSLKSPRES